ncbi:MAG TPA: histidine phosphatase family protein [Candidatus Eisenbacteria bacterium]
MIRRVTGFALGMIVIALGAARAPAAPAAPPDSARASSGVRYLYLVRHGDYDRDARADDRVGNGLNALGREQARKIGERLARLPVRPTSLVSSDFTRARETCDIMGQVLRMAPSRDSLLRECTPTSDTGPGHAGEPDEGEPCDARLEAAWARYARPAPGADARDVLVCHGNVIRWFVSRALGADARRWRAMEIANASLTVIVVRADGSTRLAMFSDVGHLPVEDQTWTGRGAGWTASPGPATRMR